MLRCVRVPAAAFWDKAYVGAGWCGLQIFFFFLGGEGGVVVGHALRKRVVLVLPGVTYGALAYGPLAHSMGRIRPPASV